MSLQPFPTFFLSHGGGPWPYMDGEFRSRFDLLETSLEGISRGVHEKPKAILMISGHWEEETFTVMSNPSPGMLYDYSGFPASTYRVRYPAPGSPGLALRIEELLRGAGMNTRQDGQRGFDHGAFVPLAVMYPGADVPVVQLSLHEGYDPDLHLRAGMALAPLRDEGILIVGSGLSYHNLGRFGPGAKEESRAFDRWLNQTLMAPDPDERVSRLRSWENAPAARLAHPREDHLLPLMVAVGAAREGTATQIYHEEDFFGGLAVSSFRFD